MNQKKIPKRNSKKGMSLVELLVGVTIIAMVMGSTSGAIVMGYKTTVDNAAKNQAAARSASLNELLMYGIKNYDFIDSTDVQDHLLDLTDANNAVHNMAVSVFPDVQYSVDADYPDSHYDLQYNIDPDAEEILQGTSSATIKGIRIRTAAATPDGGFAEIVSFMPYADQ